MSLDLDQFSVFSEVPAELEPEVNSLFKKVFVKKNELFPGRGEIRPFIFLLEEGLTGKFMLENNTWWLYQIEKEGSAFLSRNMFEKLKIGQESFMAFEKCVLWGTPEDDFDSLVQKHPTLVSIFNKILLGIRKKNEDYQLLRSIIQANIGNDVDNIIQFLIMKDMDPDILRRASAGRLSEYLHIPERKVIKFRKAIQKGIHLFPLGGPNQPELQLYSQEEIEAFRIKSDDFPRPSGN